MEDKYYTPKIEEFHVGFEYWLKSKEPTSTKRVPIVINSFSDVQDAIRHFAFDDIVVKYLSKEDIESFGFEFDGTRSKVIGNFVGSYLNEKYYLDYSPYNHKGEFNDKVHLRILKIKDIPTNGEFMVSQDNYKYIFDGIIKNKSELKKLLIQLNIINE